jgi:Leucine-rich repeat (LRR) protein
MQITREYHLSVRFIRCFSSFSAFRVLYDSKTFRLIPTTLLRFEALVALIVERCTLPSVGSGLFQRNLKLQRISFHSNLITSIAADSFSGLSAINEISLSSNAITLFHATMFSSNTALKNLGFGGNLLTFLPVGIFDKLVSLEAVYMNDNLITAFDDKLIFNNVKLKTFDASSNPLTSIPVGFFDRNMQLERM